MSYERTGLGANESIRMPASGKCPEGMDPFFLEGTNESYWGCATHVEPSTGSGSLMDAIRAALVNGSLTSSTASCPAGQELQYAGTRSERCVPIVATTSSPCPAGQTRAFATQQCQPVCSTYQCPTGKSKVEFNRSYVGTAAQDSRTRQQALVARGCTVAPCSNGPQLITGSAKITYCCPPQAATTATLATPPPPTIVYTTPQVQQTVSRGYGPLFWIGLGCVGVGLILVLRGRS